MEIIKDFIISGVETGKLNALVKTIMVQTGIENPSEAINLFVSQRVKFEIDTFWEDNGVIFLTVTSNGIDGKEWVKRLSEKGFQISDLAKDVLLSDNFNPTEDITYNIAVLKGEIFSTGECQTKKILDEADRRHLVKPNAEVSCLIREKFSDAEFEKMGLWWILTMHEPIKGAGGIPLLLDTNRLGTTGLHACDCDPNKYWDCMGGFAFSLQSRL